MAQVMAVEHPCFFLEKRLADMDSLVVITYERLIIITPSICVKVYCLENLPALHAVIFEGHFELLDLLLGSRGSGYGLCMHVCRYCGDVRAYMDSFLLPSYPGSKENTPRLLFVPCAKRIQSHSILFL